MSAGGEEAFVPDMDRRTAMNLILAGSIGINVLGLAVPYIAFFVPPGAGGSGGGVTAKDAIGNEVTTESWLATHGVGSRELAEGIKVGGRLPVCCAHFGNRGVSSLAMLLCDAVCGSFTLSCDTELPRARTTRTRFPRASISRIHSDTTRRRCVSNTCRGAGEWKYLDESYRLYMGSSRFPSESQVVSCKTYRIRFSSFARQGGGVTIVPSCRLFLSLEIHAVGKMLLPSSVRRGGKRKDVHSVLVRLPESFLYRFRCGVIVVFPSVESGICAVFGALAPTTALGVTVCRWRYFYA